eukprot:1162077-Pelagomonas_calceolata.AAC.7
MSCNFFIVGHPNMEGRGWLVHINLFMYMSGCLLLTTSSGVLQVSSSLNVLFIPARVQARAWLSVAAVLRAMNYVLLGSGVLPGLPSHPDCSFMWYILLVWEAGASVVEQVRSGACVIVNC